MFSNDFCPAVDSQYAKRFVFEQKVIDALVEGRMEAMDAIYCLRSLGMSMISSGEISRS